MPERKTVSGSTQQYLSLPSFRPTGETARTHSNGKSQERVFEGYDAKLEALAQVQVLRHDVWLV